MWLFILSIIFSVNIALTINNITFWWIGIDVFIGTALIVEIIEHSIDYYFIRKI